MSRALLDNAVDSIVHATTIDTIDKVIAAFRDKFDLDEQELSVFKEDFVRNTVPRLSEVGEGASMGGGKASPKKGSSSAKQKGTRAPTQYNLYIRDKIAEIKANNPDMKGKDLMRRATEAWKADRDAKMVTLEGGAESVVESAA